MERIFCIFIIFTAASVYAYLAGVIVELVSRAGENARDVDGIFDSLVDYMDATEFPHKKRPGLLRFFWASRKYLVCTCPPP